MLAPSIDRLVDDAAATVADLRAFTKGNGGRTRLLWSKNHGAVRTNEAIVVCATNDADIRALADFAQRLWGANANTASRQN